MARTLQEIQTELIFLRERIATDTARAEEVQKEFQSLKYGFYQGEPVELDGVSGTIWFDGLMFTFQDGTLKKVYVTDLSKLKKKV